MGCSQRASPKTVEMIVLVTRILTAAQNSRFIMAYFWIGAGEGVACDHKLADRVSPCIVHQARRWHLFPHIRLAQALPARAKGRSLATRTMITAVVARTLIGGRAELFSLMAASRRCPTHISSRQSDFDPLTTATTLRTDPCLGWKQDARSVHIASSIKAKTPRDTAWRKGGGGSLGMEWTGKREMGGTETLIGLESSIEVCFKIQAKIL